MDMHTTPSRIGLRTLFAAAILSSLAGSAVAQDALGDGHALDNPRQVGGPAYNPNRRDFRDELRLRNAIVTGNAPGGLSFRGDVGYTSPLEFRGELGSDDTFAFRRDSLYSGLAGAGIRGTDALQYQFALTTGGRLPEGLTGQLAYTRDGSVYSRSPTAPTGSAPNGAVDPSRRPGQWDSTLERAPVVDEPTSQTSMLRSTGAYTSTRSYQPYLVAAIQTDSAGQDRVGLTANPLRGLRIADFAEPDDDRQPPAGRISTAYDDVVARAIERIKALEEPVTPQPGAVDASEPERPPQTEVEAWARRMAEIRRKLRGEPEQPDTTQPGTAQPGATQPGTTQPGTTQPGTTQPGTTQPGTTQPGAGGGGDESGTGPRGTIRFDPKTMELIRGDGTRVGQLLGEGVDADSAYVKHMRVADAAMRHARYFEAEDRFTLALSAQPNDVAAQSGRVNAQLGAGLFLSAGLNLRQLVVTAPEVAGMRFSPELLPSAARLDALRGLLRANLGLEGEGAARSPGRRLERESGLMLAYLGFQTSDAASVEAGLDAWDESIRASEAEGNDEGPDRALLRFVRELWTNPGGTGSGGTKPGDAG